MPPPKKPDAGDPDILAEVMAAESKAKPPPMPSPTSAPTYGLYAFGGNTATIALHGPISSALSQNADLFGTYLNG